MNRRRNHRTRKLTFSELTLIVMTGVILVTAGVLHAWLKNNHVKVQREISQTQSRVQDHQDATNSLQVKIDKKLNIYQLRDDLKRNNSSLVKIPASEIKVISSNPNRIPVNKSTDPVVATATP